MLIRGRLALSLFMMVSAAALVAAGQTTASAPQPRPEQTALRDAMKLTDPAAKLKALDEVIAKYPDATSLVDVCATKIATLQAIQPVDLAAVDAAIAKARVVKTPRTPHEVLNLLAITLMNAPETIGRAEALDREAIAMLDEATYVRDWQARFVKNPNDQKEVAAQAKEGKSRFLGTNSIYHLYLARILLKAGRDTEAKAEFETSLTFNPLQGSAALALAGMAEKAGDAAEAYKRLSWAAVTGRLTDADRPRLDAAYAKAHAGAKPGDVEADLDRLYRDSFKNPITTGRYAPSKARTNRVVLAEMFTGAGCVPCLSTDLSFEAMLDRYTRKDLVVLMYHIHAPTPDPLSNASVQARGKYYNVNSAPTTFIDGTSETIEGPRADAPETFITLDAVVGHHLEEASAALIKLNATMKGTVVTAQAEIAGVPAGSADLRIQLVLVEQVVRYSGENGQRFHPMVTRAFGGTDMNGWAIEGSNRTRVAHTFDLDALAAGNLKYYEDYALDMKTRIGLGVSFHEKKHVIDPKNVAVVAFVQDVKTRRVLQAAWITPGMR
jgi:tetratricopeptide (TPR) repeat protein